MTNDLTSLGLKTIKLFIRFTINVEVPSQEYLCHVFCL